MESWIVLPLPSDVESEQLLSWAASKLIFAQIQSCYGAALHACKLVEISRALVTNSRARGFGFGFGKAKLQKRLPMAEARPPKKDLHRFVKWPKYVRIQSFESSTAEGSAYDQPIHQLDQQHGHDIVMLILPSPAAALFKMLLKKDEWILKRAERSRCQRWFQ
ncbi:hypothetical protein SELMODRAFT_413265 [Selaginella moellendorffii]|uniref:60S ribosomal protein L7a n=1 Tax=Selaginella moellendorffii TaxID=88036 RepID=D8RNW3_SELML|nr:hypothetical protein SELMODRAFT_413265 [Selaginella moellendorffii]